MRTLVQRLFRWIGFEIRRYRTDGAADRQHARDSLKGVLEQVKETGFAPATVIDVGAAMGSFTKTCYNFFPDAHYLLIEPLKEYLPALTKVVQAIPRATYEIKAASASEDSVVLNVHEDLVGSSLYREMEEDSGVNGLPRQVPAVTIDELVSQRRAQRPFLIKVDVQGAELDVLSGAKTTLGQAELVLLEVSLFEFFRGAPLLGEVVAFMKAHGFVPYDVLGLQYRPIDGALSQLDIVFVKEQGAFRKVHAYATAEQRRAQNQEYRSYLLNVLSAERVP
ncbi:MAG TPA: FkbM family methyltransferase [Nitrospira sp.]|nr:FkbM family methyltransferase [Nitrospira sp.]